jgi:hypothetical protein
MNALRKVAVFFFMVCLLLGFASVAKADQHDKLTVVTFSAPVEIPGGKVLPAGTYTFKLLDSLGDRNIVQIFDKNRTKLYATVLAIPDYRPNPSDKTIIKFSETASGGPVAIKEWFYPGDNYGQEFVYPKSRAVEIAKSSNQNVPSMPTEMASNINEPAKTSNDSSVAAMKDTPLKAEEPSGEEVEVARVFIVEAPVEVAAVQPTKLPKTASLLPVLLLSGILLMVFGGLLWMISRRPA